MDPASRYELLEKIGAGSFATVYRARDNELQREVAIRAIHTQYLDEPRFLDRYWAEAQLLASVQHPHIVTIYDIVRSEGWLILELMQANLRDRLAGRPMDLRALKTTLIHALKALKYLHNRGIIHGDINPANLMVDHRKRVKVGDFGIARRVARTDGSVSRGSAKYMAPEALSGDINQVGPSSDLYSLGFSCYELMCGSSFVDLFPGLNTDGPDAQAAWMMWHAASDRMLPPIREVLEGVPQDLAAVIERMTQKAPKDRFQSADEVLTQLGDESKGSERESRHSGPTAENASPASSPRWWVIALFVISALLSLSILLIPTKPSKPLTAPPAKYGIVRRADLERNILEVEDQLTGIPEETTLPTKPKIRLVRQGENDLFILPRDIVPGDWIEIQQAAEPEGAPLYVVTRPIIHKGEIRQLNVTARRIVVSLISGRLKDEMAMYLPERTIIHINESPAKLEDIRLGDQVEVEHLLDPTGVKGEIVSRLQITRSQEVTGFVTGIDSTRRTLTINEKFGATGGQEFPVSEDASFILSDQTPVPFDGVRQGDRITLKIDSQIRTATITRGDHSEKGVLLDVRQDGTILIGADSGHQLLLSVTEKTDLRLGQEQITLNDLRLNYDRLNVTIENTADNQRMAKAIDATRPPKHDRWALIIGNGTFQDGSIDPLPHAGTDVNAIQQTLVNRYAVNPMWCELYVDQTLAVTSASIDRFLAQVTEPMQLIVVVIGRTIQGGDGKAYLAMQDSRSNEIATSGLSLDALIESLERCPAGDKLLLLDATPATNRPDAPASYDLPRTLSSIKTPLKTIQVIGASSEGEQSHTIDDGKRGWFGKHLELALAGAADKNRDMKIDADEFIQYLEPAAFASEPPIPQHPFLWKTGE